MRGLFFDSYQPELTIEDADIPYGSEDNLDRWYARHEAARRQEEE